MMRGVVSVRDQLCLSFFRAGAISGLGWIGMGWDLCAGLFYEHRFAMLIIAG